MTRVTSMFFLLILIGPYAIAQQAKQLNAQDFEKKLKEANQPILLDVRTQGEFAQGHIHNAQLMDIFSSDFKSRANSLDKSKPVFVYCKAGSRSNSAVDILSDLGFKEIYDLDGGILAWTKSNKPIEKK